MTKRRSPPPPSLQISPASIRGCLSPEEAKRFEEAMKGVRSVVENTLSNDSLFEEHERTVREITKGIGGRARAQKYRRNRTREVATR